MSQKPNSRAPHSSITWLIHGSLVVAILSLMACSPAVDETPAPDPEPQTSDFGNNPYCSDGTVLCSTLPGQEIQVPDGCESFDQQCSRDFWSWQNFVSLNWPGTVSGTTVEPNPSAGVGDPGERVWEMWMDPNAVFLPAAVKPVWTPNAGAPPVACTSGDAKQLIGRSAKASVSFGQLDPNDFIEATIQQPLIDQSLNFVVFEIRMNQQEVEWVISNSLYQQETVNGLTTNLTMPADAIEIKGAWRIIPDEMPTDQQARYYRRQATIVLDPSHVEGGSGTEPVCLVRELGLIGLHIRHHGLRSTFEQVDNEAAAGAISPTLNNPSCSDCTDNVPPTNPDGSTIKAADYKWTTSGASASLYEGFPNVPSQITHAPGQEQWINKDLNTFFQNTVLAGTVWQHYMLITTNWLEFPTSSQPVPSLNTSLEPYLPSNTQFPQACIDCHKLAQNGNGALLGETFLVFRACPEGVTSGADLPPNCVVTNGVPGVETLAASD